MKQQVSSNFNLTQLFQAFTSDASIFFFFNYTEKPQLPLLNTEVLFYSIRIFFVHTK